MTASWDEPHMFTVEGRGEFPFDMLRHSECWPTTSVDANRIGAKEKRRVTLTASKVCWIRPARWESFGWRVVDGFDEFGYPTKLDLTDAI